MTQGSVENAKDDFAIKMKLEKCHFLFLFFSFSVFNYNP